jgi:hypothetical protein
VSSRLPNGKLGTKTLPQRGEHAVAARVMANKTYNMRRRKRIWVGLWSRRANGRRRRRVAEPKQAAWWWPQLRAELIRLTTSNTAGPLVRNYRLIDCLILSSLSLFSSFRPPGSASSATRCLVLFHTILSGPTHLLLPFMLACITRLD